MSFWHRGEIQIKKKIDLIKNKNYYVSRDNYSEIYNISSNKYFTVYKSYCEFVYLDTCFKITKILEKKGKGPGEFSIISTVINNKKEKELYLIDRQIKRVTTLNYRLNCKKTALFDNLNLFSFYNFRNINLKIGIFINKDKKIYLCEKQKENELSKLFFLENKENSIFFEDQLYIGDLKSINFKNSIVFVYSHLPYFHIYDYKNQTTQKKTIAFPSYINPLKINYSKLRNQKKLQKLQLNYLNRKYFTFSPIFFAYDKINKIFILQFNRPFNDQYDQFKTYKDVDNYTVVFFNNSFDYLYSYNTKHRFLLLDYQNNTSYILKQKKQNMYFKIDNNKRSNRKYIQRCSIKVRDKNEKR